MINPLKNLVNIAKKNTNLISHTQSSATDKQVYNISQPSQKNKPVSSLKFFCKIKRIAKKKKIALNRPRMSEKEIKDRFRVMGLGSYAAIYKSIVCPKSMSYQQL